MRASSTRRQPVRSRRWLGLRRTILATAILVSLNAVLATDHVLWASGGENACQDPAALPPFFWWQEEDPEGEVFEAPVVAASGDGRYLVLWAQEGGQGGQDKDFPDPAILARELVGGALSEPLLLQVAPGQKPDGSWEDGEYVDPAAAADGKGRYLAAWAAEDDSGAHSVEVALVTADAFGAGAPQQTQSCPTDCMPDDTAVAYNPDSEEWLVVWDRDCEDAGDPQIQAARFKVDGDTLIKLFEGNNYTTIHTGSQADQTAVVYDPASEHYVVAWVDEKPFDRDDVRVKLVTGDGTAVRPVVTVSQDDGPGDGPDREAAGLACRQDAASRSSCLVVWGSLPRGQEEVFEELWGRFFGIDREGTLLLGETFHDIGADHADFDGVGAAWVRGDMFLVSWSTADSGVHVQYLDGDASAAAIGAPAKITARSGTASQSIGAEQPEFLNCAAGSCLLLWKETGNCLDGSPGPAVTILGKGVGDLVLDIPIGDGDFADYSGYGRAPKEIRAASTCSDSPCSPGRYAGSFVHDPEGYTFLAYPAGPELEPGLDSFTVELDIKLDDDDVNQMFECNERGEDCDDAYFKSTLLVIGSGNYYHGAVNLDLWRESWWDREQINLRGRLTSVTGGRPDIAASHAFGKPIITSLSDGQWHTLALVINRPESAVALFLDHELIAFQPTESYAGIFFAADPDLRERVHVRVGGYPFWPLHRSGFQGAIDNVRILRSVPPRYQLSKAAGGDTLLRMPLTEDMADHGDYGHLIEHPNGNQVLEREECGDDDCVWFTKARSGVRVATHEIFAPRTEDWTVKATIYAEDLVDGAGEPLVGTMTIIKASPHREWLRTSWGVGVCNRQQTGSAGWHLCADFMAGYGTEGGKWGRLEYKLPAASPETLNKSLGRGWHDVEMRLDRVDGGAVNLYLFLDQELVDCDSHQVFPSIEEEPSWTVALGGYSLLEHIHGFEGGIKNVEVRRGVEDSSGLICP